MPNTVFHYEQRQMENDLVALEIFDPAIHAAQFVNKIEENPEVLEYLSLPAFHSEEEFIRFYDENIRSSLGECLYAIVDKTRTSEGRYSDHAFAGVASLNATSKQNAITELGIVIFPAFQRTHVSTNTIGLLLLYTLDSPALGGLGLRRVEWQAHTKNEASRRTAVRMGFEFEGIARWQRAAPVNRAGISVNVLERRNGTNGEAPGRHTAIYSLVWEEWEEKRAKVLSLMQRR